MHSLHQVIERSHHLLQVHLVAQTATEEAEAPSTVRTAAVRTAAETHTEMVTVTGTAVLSKATAMAESTEMETVTFTEMAVATEMVTATAVHSKATAMAESTEMVPVARTQTVERTEQVALTEMAASMEMERHHVVFSKVTAA